ATGVARHGVEPRGVPGVAHVVDQRPGAVERGRPEIVPVPRDDVAGRVTDAAADALDAGVGRPPLRRRRRHHGEVLCRRGPRLEKALGVTPFVEELRHVDREILDDGEVAQRLQLEPAVARDLRYARTAGPARTPVHHHRAGAAHADAAGEAIGECWILLALDLGDDVEDGLVFPARNLEGLEAAFARPAPDIDGEHDLLSVIPARPQSPICLARPYPFVMAGLVTASRIYPACGSQSGRPDFRCYPGLLADLRKHEVDARAGERPWL